MTAIPFLQTIEHQHHPVNRGVVGCIPYFHWREKKSSAGWMEKVDGRDSLVVGMLSSSEASANASYGL